MKKFFVLPLSIALFATGSAEAAHPLAALAGTYGYGSSGTFNGQEYAEVGVLRVDAAGGLTATQVLSFAPDTPLESTCTLTGDPAGFVEADCIAVSLGNAPYTLYIAVDALKSELRFYGSSPVLFGSGVARRQLIRDWRARDVVGTYGYSSRGKLLGAPYLEVGYLDFNSDGTLYAAQRVSALGNALGSSDCTFTVVASGLGKSQCLGSSGVPYNVYFVMSLAGAQINFFGLMPDVLLGSGEGLRQ